MLRARHLPFSIGAPERDAWVRHMTAAIASADADEATKAEFLAYIDDAATFMINQGLGPLNLRPPG
jgi:hemoglobin